MTRVEKLETIHEKYDYLFDERPDALDMMSRLVDLFTEPLNEINNLTFDVRTIKWISHKEKDSEYDKGWNHALDALNMELTRILTKDN